MHNNDDARQSGVAKESFQELLNLVTNHPPLPSPILLMNIHDAVEMVIYGLGTETPVHLTVGKELLQGGSFLNLDAWPNLVMEEVEGSEIRVTGSKGTVCSIAATQTSNNLCLENGVDGVDGVAEK